jgi:hypothetical protein
LGLPPLIYLENKNYPQALARKTGLKKQKNRFHNTEINTMIKVGRFTALSNVARLYIQCDGVMMR